MYGQSHPYPQPQGTINSSPDPGESSSHQTYTAKHTVIKLNGHKSIFTCVSFDKSGTYQLKADTSMVSYNCFVCEVGMLCVCVCVCVLCVCVVHACVYVPTLRLLITSGVI